MTILRVSVLLTSFLLTKSIRSITANMLSSNTSDTFYSTDDLQCLTQMPMAELLRIQKNLHLMHAVSEYNGNAVRMEAISRIDNHHTINTNNSNLGGSQPALESRHIFHNFDSSEAAAAAGVQNPSVASLSMPNDARNHYGYNRFGQRTGYSYPAPSSDWDEWEEPPSKIQKVLHFSLTALSFLAFSGYLLCMIIQAIKAKGTTYFHSVHNLLPLVMKKRRPNRYRRQTNEDFGPAEPDPFSLYSALVSISKGYVQLDRIDSMKFV